MPTPLTHLGKLSIDDFLREYWQKKPLFIKNALSGFCSPLSPEELAGFTLETDIESRLIIETPKADPLKSDWAVQNGPLDESTFETLPENHWTLLVQAVDQFIPEVHQLLHEFRFLPNWRLDDIMASYAVDGGNVGPHFDYYDVFLLQGFGKRTWKVGQACNEKSPLRTDTPLKLLTEFAQTKEYNVEPGDLLYIPANVAHWGIAHGESITYSIGFRAPSKRDIILSFANRVSEKLQDDERFQDQLACTPENPGEIDSHTLHILRNIIADTLNDENLASWFGSYMTEPQRQTPDIDWEDDEDINYKNDKTLPLWILSPHTRAAYVTFPQKNILFIDGEELNCSIELAKKICNYTPINKHDLSKLDNKCLSYLIDNGLMEANKQ